MSGRTEFGEDVRWRVRERMRELWRERVGKRERGGGGRGKEGGLVVVVEGGGGKRNEHTYADW